MKNTNIKEVMTEKIISALAFKRKLIGCGYIREALLICCRYPDGRTTLSTNVYPVIGKRHNKSSSSVEHAISNAISNCFYHGNLKFLNVLLNSEVVSDKYPPTNGEFLAALASFLFPFDTDDDAAQALYILKNPPKNKK